MKEVTPEPNNAVFIHCKTCGLGNRMRVILQVQGMSITCDMCGKLAIFIKPKEFDLLIEAISRNITR